MKCIICRYRSVGLSARTNGNNRMLLGPRRSYFCEHRNARESFEKNSKSSVSPCFIGYSKPGEFVPNIKTCPRWCPLKFKFD